MTIHEARLIRALKKRSTYRYLAEVYYPETHCEHGLQGSGEELCKEALELLYPGQRIWETRAKEQSAEFGLENVSSVGAFFWWE